MFLHLAIPGIQQCSHHRFSTLRTLDDYMCHLGFSTKACLGLLSSFLS